MTMGSITPRGVTRTLAALALLAGPAAAPVAAWADDGAEHQGHVRPLEFGVSGSSIEHVIDGVRLFCYMGTLGALVEDSLGSRHALSNNHVLAKENEPDSALLAPDGYEIIQPGLADEGACTGDSGAPANVVARLSYYVPLQFGRRNAPALATADVAVAELTTGNVAANGAILDIGPLTGDPVPATLGMLVQKSGRTTGHTLGEVTGVAVSVKVEYQSGFVRYDDQIEVTGVCGTDFSAGGDSGSLIVNLVDGAPRAGVGLLFAGGDSLTIANPIETALAALSAEGGAPPVSLVVGGVGDVSDLSANAARLACPSGGGGKGGGKGGNNGNGGGRPSGAGAAGAIDPLGLEIAAEVAADHSDTLFAIPGVVGHGIGADTEGNPVIRVYVESERREAGRPLPTALEGYAVQVVVAGRIRAY